jgi:23S rRNA (cytosine1962-C5)-methyltransferase
MEIPESPLPKIRVNTQRRNSHPWFSWKEVDKPELTVKNGSVVDIEDKRGQWLGRGFYNGHARVRLRVLTRDPRERVDAAFFEARLRAAFDWRRSLGLIDNDEITSACRLVHSEGDDLSGLIVDRYGSVIALQFFSNGMFRFRKEIEAALAALVPDAQFYLFSEKHIQKQESFDVREMPAIDVVIRENGLKFKLEVGSKHKTGFFLDQRENRKSLAKLCRDKSLLDLCAHTGGFSVAAAKKGAKGVQAVDLDPLAVEMAMQNASLNNVKLAATAADLFEWLPQNSKTYDVVVLDPPRQTRSEHGIDDALKRYFAMNRLALKGVKPGGIFLTCSCSGRISEKDFVELLREAASESKRRLQIFNLSGAAPDHPFMVDAPESRYLKAVWARVLN